jgi:hypothetical protein
MTLQAGFTGSVPNKVTILLHERFIHGFPESIQVTAGVIDYLECSYILTPPPGDYMHAFYRFAPDIPVHAC